MVACERRGDRSATNQNYSEAADWSLAADDEQQLRLTSRKRLQAVSFSSAVSLMGRAGPGRSGASGTATSSIMFSPNCALKLVFVLHSWSLSNAGSLILNSEREQ